MGLSGVLNALWVMSMQCRIVGNAAYSETRRVARLPCIFSYCASKVRRSTSCYAAGPRHVREARRREAGVLIAGVNATKFQAAQRKKAVMTQFASAVPTARSAVCAQSRTHSW